MAVPVGNESARADPRSDRSRRSQKPARVATDRRPTAAELQAARNKRVRDVIAPNLDVLFVGINPGLYTAAVGHHFARPGNRFWPALRDGGFTDRLLAPHEERELLERGCGITNVVNRATVDASELSRDEIVAGGRALTKKVRRYRPRLVVILGLTTYRTAFDRPKAQLGRQPEDIAGSELWVLPNPSGLNAHFKPADFGRLFRQLRDAVHRDPIPSPDSRREKKRVRRTFTSIRPS